MGGKRISDAKVGDDPAAYTNSFNMTVTEGGTDSYTIKGYYPMQKTSMQYMYLTCSEAGGNLRSQNIGYDYTVRDSHMVSSQLLAKIPVQHKLCSWQSPCANCPYFVTSQIATLPRSSSPFKIATVVPYLSWTRQLRPRATCLAT